MKNRLDRKRSNDTTSGGSDVTVIEGNVPDEVFDDDKIDEPGVESDKASDESKWKPTTLPSCLLRRDSSRASIKKKVRCSEATEVIPAPDYFINDDNLHEAIHEDDDDVFSDSAPVQTPRGNMCTPYVERKGSLPGLEALPDWFPNSRLLIQTNLSIKSIHSSVSCFHISLFVYASRKKLFRYLVTQPCLDIFNLFALLPGKIPPIDFRSHVQGANCLFIFFLG